MNENEIGRFYSRSAEKLSGVMTSFKRFSYSDVNCENRLIGLKGPRGVGKTTLLQQKAKDSGEELRRTLYVSLDSVWIDAKGVYELAEYHVRNGGTRLILDEVHYVKEWQRVLKNLYDDFKELKIAYSGSSLLKLKANEGDLSRRHIGYTLPGLSFREFLKLEGLLSAEPIPLETLLKDHVEIAADICSGIKILPLFDRYFKSGYYPFYREDGCDYLERVMQSVNQTLDSDWPSVEEVSPDTIRKARKMLRILAELPPQTPKMTALYSQLDTERRQGLKILYALERAGLVKLLAADYEALDNLCSPEKIYCGDTNLLYSLSPTPDIGTARETFFMNQLSVAHRLTYPKKGDFFVDDRYLFEIGGKGKKFRQIKDIPDSFVVNDGVEIGFGNKIPLWLFGFLY